MFLKILLIILGIFSSFNIIRDIIEVILRNKSIKENKETIKKILAENDFDKYQLYLIRRGINKLNYEKLVLILDPKIPSGNMSEILDMFNSEKLTKKEVLEILDNVPNGIYGKSDDVNLAKNNFLIYKKSKIAQ